MVPFWRRALCLGADGPRCWAQLNRQSVRQTETVEIAPGIQASCWLGLQLDAPGSPDWERALCILKARIRERYLEPTSHLISHERERPASSRKFGFSVMAISCLLVETLESFAQGVLDTKGRSESLFMDFLGRQEFAPPFDDRLAKVFYKDVRCGILHIGETQRDAQIWSIGPLVKPHGNSIRINRTEFYEQLESYFRNYLASLANPAEAELRTNLRKKMDFIARKSAA